MVVKEMCWSSKMTSSSCLPTLSGWGQLASSSLNSCIRHSSDTSIERVHLNLFKRDCVQQLQGVSGSSRWGVLAVYACLPAGRA